MNRAVSLLLPVLLSCVSLLANVRVLSIGISEYPESSGWNSLNADNDVRLMMDIFPDAVVLENKQATRREIECRLKAIALNVAEGDTIIIHFSGHGQQIITAKSAEEIDRVDEAIVPYDAARCKSDSYTGGNHFTDEDFGNAVDDIRKAVGPTGLVIALIDACHSDSMDKGPEHNGGIYRGTDEIFGSENMTDAEISEIREAYHNQEEPSLAKAPDMSDVIYLSACKSDKRNYEVVVDDRGYGSLTYYFAEAYRATGLDDPGKFLSAIYDGMKSDKTLQFHEQLPAIRNTIGWEAPSEVLRITDSENQDTYTTQAGETASLSAGIAVLTAVVLIAIFIALWMTRTKKK